MTMASGSVADELDVIARYEAKVEARKLYLKEQKPKNLASREEKAMSLKECFREMYGHAAAEQVLPRQSLAGQSVIEVEYDRAGRIIKSQVKFEKFNCTGAAGIEAADTAEKLLKSNIACKEDSKDISAPEEEKQVATWTIKVPDGSVLDRVTFAEALLKVAAEDIDAYGMKKFHHDDPMKDFLN